MVRATPAMEVFRFGVMAAITATTAARTATAEVMAAATLGAAMAVAAVVTD